jgi:hypothetical protein
LANIKDPLTVGQQAFGGKAPRELVAGKRRDKCWSGILV